MRKFPAGSTPYLAGFGFTADQLMEGRAGTCLANTQSGPHFKLYIGSGVFTCPTLKSHMMPDVGWWHDSGEMALQAIFEPLAGKVGPEGALPIRPGFVFIKTMNESKQIAGIL